MLDAWYICMRCAHAMAGTWLHETLLFFFLCLCCVCACMRVFVQANINCGTVPLLLDISVQKMDGLKKEVGSKLNWLPCWDASALLKRPKTLVLPGPARSICALQSCRLCKWDGCFFVFSGKGTWWGGGCSDHINVA